MNQNKRPRLQFDDSSADDSGSASSRFVPPTRNGRQLLNNNNAVGVETSALEAEEEEAAIATTSLVIGNNNNNAVHNEEAAEEVDDAIQSNIKDHHLVALLTTVICTHKDCNCKIAARGGLWTVSRQTIDRHLTNNNCWDNSKKKPSMRKLQKQLMADQIAKHNRIQNNPQLARRMIDEEFPS